jgi:putative flippase GtrA
MSVPAPHTLICWLRFNLVGAIGVAVQFAALFALKSMLGLPYLAATAIAVEFTVVHNFIWHERFTWADRRKQDSRTRSWLGISSYVSSPRLSWQSLSWHRLSWQRLARFNLSNGAISLVGNLALMKVMVGQGRMNYLLANAIAIALCSLANFLVSKKWVFEDRVS